jgi:TolB-like protein
MKRILIAVLIGCLLGVTGPPAPLGAQQQIKVSVFNFGALNIEASGYGTSVTNMLINTLAADPLLAIMDRKDLENFLSFNDLQQNDKLDNVVLIGSKLGLNIIVVGTVEKRGTVIHIKSNVIQIERKRSIHHARVAALGDAGLTQEVQKLGGEIQKAIRDHLLKRDEGETGDLKSPERIEKRSGNRRVSLSWDAPEKSVTGYEIFRSLDAKGPYVKIARITATEYLDEGLEKNTTYYYKVRPDPQSTGDPVHGKPHQEHRPHLGAGTPGQRRPPQAQGLQALPGQGRSRPVSGNRQHPRGGSGAGAGRNPGQALQGPLPGQGARGRRGLFLPGDGL